MEQATVIQYYIYFKGKLLLPLYHHVLPMTLPTKFSAESMATEADFRKLADSTCQITVSCRVFPFKMIRIRISDPLYYLGSGYIK